MTSSADDPHLVVAGSGMPRDSLPDESSLDGLVMPMLGCPDEDIDIALDR